MLQRLDGIESCSAYMQDFQNELGVCVQKAADEIAKSRRRNATLITANNAKIDGLVRNFTMFMADLNRIRVAQEDKASNQGEVINLRREWGILTGNSNRLRVDLNNWGRVRDLVIQQSKPRRRKLYEPEDKLPHSTYHQMCASDDVFEWLVTMINPAAQSQIARDHQCFPDIGLPNSDFHAHLHAAYRVLLTRDMDHPTRFLDVGCGGGLKVFSAQRYFDEVSGFDFDPAYVRAANQFLSRDPDGTAEVFEQDALTYDGYEEYDVIYFYRPISDDAVLAEMERRICEICRPGTLLIAPYRSFPSRAEGLGCGHIGGAVYLAQTAQKDADKARRLAEQTGPFIIKDTNSPLSSVWDPILTASRRNGYDLAVPYKKPRH